MITVSAYSNKDIKKLDFKNFKPAAFSRATTWIDVIDPSHQELSELSAKTKIPLDYLKSQLHEKERPIAQDLANYSLITFKAPISLDDESKLIPIGIFFDQTTIITIRKIEIAALGRVKDALRSRKDLLLTPVSFLYSILDEILYTYFMILESVEKDIESVEKDIRKVKEDTYQDIFLAQRRLIFLYQANTANREVINLIEKGYLSKIKRSDLNKFHDLYNDITQLIDTEAVYRDILTGTLDASLYASSNKLNAILKTLTIITAFLLVPTLIAGIYGMNFRYMPEIGWRYGYQFSLVLMALSIIIMYFFFKRKGWM